MKRFVFGLSLLLLCAPAAAEWTRLDDNGTVAGYIDLATVHKQGNTVTMSSLLDFKSVQRKDGRLYLSLTVEFEINCEEQRSRILAVAAYSGNMGQGEIVMTEPSVDRPWESVRPRTRLDSLWQIGCKRMDAAMLRLETTDMKWLRTK